MGFSEVQRDRGPCCDGVQCGHPEPTFWETGKDDERDSNIGRDEDGERPVASEERGPAGRVAPVAAKRRREQRRSTERSIFPASLSSGWTDDFGGTGPAACRADGVAVPMVSRDPLDSPEETKRRITTTATELRKFKARGAAHRPETPKTAVQAAIEAAIEHDRPRSAVASPDGTTGLKQSGPKNCVARRKPRTTPQANDENRIHGRQVEETGTTTDRALSPITTPGAVRSG